ncbi:MAG: histidine phosphatase family protein [Candidatus Paceibacterota bacterium]|jgi:broad specificity phosphatase PhoE
MFNASQIEHLIDRDVRGDVKVKQQLLHPEAVVYIFRHGHAEQVEDGIEDDFGRVLSEKGIAQAKQLGKIMSTLGVVFDHVICSAAPRAQQTAKKAVEQFILLKGNWYDGKGRELYCPASDADFAATFALSAKMEQLFNEKTIASEISYREFKWLDMTGVLIRFMDETRQVFGSIPGISEARRIAIFNHAVMGNAVAQALFPQHVTALDTIELAPCDCVRLTATTCQHIPLMT